jgi:hypothetical protein
MIAWWSEQQAGIIGAVGGSAVGIVGAMIGSMSFLVVRGKAKGLFMGVFAAMIAIGVAALGAGLLALIQHQPYHVWYPLGLGGLVTCAVFGGLTPVILARYRAAESRRFDAEQLRRS